MPQPIGDVGSKEKGRQLIIEAVAVMASEQPHLICATNMPARLASHFGVTGDEMNTYRLPERPLKGVEPEALSEQSKTISPLLALCSYQLSNARVEELRAELLLAMKGT